MDDDGSAGRGISTGLSVFLFLAATIYLVAAVQIRPQFSEGVVGPRFLPILSALLVYGGLAQQWLTHRRSGRRAVERADLKPPMLITGMTAAYILAFPWLGYAVSTFAYVLGLFALFRFRAGHPLIRTGYAVLLTALFWALFALAFGIRLPKLAGIV